MTLEELKVKKLSELVGQTLTHIIPTHDGQILLFGSNCVHQGSETGYELDETHIIENKSFDPLQHYLFFRYSGLITEEQAVRYAKVNIEKAEQEIRERELVQLKRLKQKYEPKTSKI